MPQSADTDMILVESVPAHHLEASEGRLRLALAAANLGIWDWDLLTGEMVYSERAKEIYGLAPDQHVTFELIRDLTHPEDLPFTSAQSKRALDPELRDRSVYEYRVARPDGTVRWVRAYGEALFGDVGGRLSAVRYTGTLQDISEEREREAERRRAEDRLRESEQRFREIANSIPVLIWMSDEQKDGTWFNRSWLEFTGRRLEDELGGGWRESIHPDDREEVDRSCEAAFADRRTVRLDFRLRRHDGAWRRVQDLGVPRFASDGAFLGYIGSVIDVEDERASEEKLRELNATLEERVARRTEELMVAQAARQQADALYRAYFENTADPLFVLRVDPDDRFVVEQTNPAHEASFGFERGAVAGKSVDELLPSDLLAQVTRYYRQCLASGTVLHYRDAFDVNGQVVHADTLLVPMRDEEGRITHLVGSSRDVTRQVQAEEALRQAQKMEAVGQLTGGIAHDFNNLLGAVMGGFDLIRRRAEDPERVRRLADAGLEAAERGARLTGQLLAFSRAQRLELKPLIVSTLVRNLGDLLERTLGPMIRLSYDLHRQLRPVLADPTQLEMAVLNLAINARDAMADGGELIIATRLRRIDEDPELAPGDYVELSVTDTGIGMSPEVASRALDPFFTTKGVGKGTGLGLSQVYGMARQSGGTVRLESRPGLGTTVRILLHCTDGPPERDVGRSEALETKAGEGALILVVDDDEDMRSMLSELLTTLGHQVVEAGDGQAALAALRMHSPALIVLDFAMPGMNGAEVARAIWQERPGLPVLFASGYAETDAIEEVGGERVRLLRKPFRLEALQAAVTEVLEEQRP